MLGNVTRYLVAFVVSAFVHLSLQASGHAELALISKPLPVFVLALLAARRGEPGLGRGVAMGLMWSGVGDVLIDLPGRFVLGMAAFAAAHVAYLFAFVRGERGRDLALLRLVPVLVWSLALLGACLPRLSSLRGAVVAYALVLTLMMWRAVARVRATDPWTWGPVSIAAGAVVFGLSDSLILMRLAGFVGNEASLAVILTYWLGQLGIAVGATRR